MASKFAYGLVILLLAAVVVSVNAVEEATGSKNRHSTASEPEFTFEINNQE